MKGTLLNTATVAAGGTVGLLAHSALPQSYMGVALSGLGLITLGIGMKLFFQAKNVVIVAVAIAVGGILGTLLGIDIGLNAFGNWAKQTLGGTGPFSEAVITTSILFCVGPMTLLGCLQDGLEGKIELLAIKSTMDGVAALFFAAAMGPGVLVSAAVVLVFQGLLTLAARPLRPLAEDPEFVAEASAAGGAMMLAIGLGLLGIKDLPVANYLPAIFLAPLIVWIVRKLPKRIHPSHAGQ